MLYTLGLGVQSETLCGFALLALVAEIFSQAGGVTVLYMIRDVMYSRYMCFQSPNIYGQTISIAAELALQDYFTLLQLFKI